MATWPAHGSANWDTALKTYLTGTGQNPITGYFHADAYGDGTLKTSNVNLAIADAKAVGGTVYMRGGDWTCDQVINMSSINSGGGPYSANVVKLKGAGHQVTKVTGGEAGYGFLEVVDSPRAWIEGINFQQTTSGLNYGILASRNTSDGSAPWLVLKDIYVTGNYNVAAMYSINIEQAHYQDCIFWTNSGAACILARDQVNRTTITAKYTAISTTAGYAGGNGVIRMERCQFTTTRNATNGPTDYPLVVEFAQTFTADSIYTLSAGPHLIVLDKRIDEATFRGLQQEWWTSGVTGATEPYGFYLKNTLTGTENRSVRLGVEGSSIYSLYGEDNVKLTSFRMKGGAWRTTGKSYNLDVYSADVLEVPVAGGNYTASTSTEQTTPTYNRRDGSVLTIQTPMQVLRASTTLDFPSISSGAASSLTMTVTGARVGDPVTVNVNPGGLTTGVVLMAGVSANDTVTVKAQNVTAAAVDPAAVTVIVTVQKFA